MTTDVVVVLCTAPVSGSQHRLGAEELAQRLVEERLCACVNVVPGVRSFFRWQGKVHAADERLLVVKTTRAACCRLRERLLALHPYEVPEVLEFDVADGLPAYLQWVVASVAPPTESAHDEGCIRGDAG